MTYTDLDELIVLTGTMAEKELLEGWQGRSGIGKGRGGFLVALYSEVSRPAVQRRRAHGPKFQILDAFQRNVDAV